MEFLRSCVEWIIEEKPGNIVTSIGTNFLFDASFETSPTFLSTKGFEASIHSIFHHGNEFLVAQHSITIIIKYLKISKKSDFSNVIELYYTLGQKPTFYPEIP